MGLFKKKSKEKKSEEFEVLEKEENSVILDEKATTLTMAAISNIGARENQQDNYGASDINDQYLRTEKGILAFVADGMGGLSNGADASAIVNAVFEDEFTKSSIGMEPHMELINMVQVANKEVHNYIDESGSDMCGSTVVAVIIKNLKMNFVSVGDSRIYLLRNSTLLQLNREHIYAGELDVRMSKGLISLEEAIANPQRNSLTSYIGIDELTQIDFNFTPVTLTKGDRILLMSDGVFGTVSEEEIVEAIDGKCANESAKALEEAVLKHSKKDQDNFTSIIIHIE